MSTPASVNGQSHDDSLSAPKVPPSPTRPLQARGELTYVGHPHSSHHIYRKCIRRCCFPFTHACYLCVCPCLVFAGSAGLRIQPFFLENRHILCVLRHFGRNGERVVCCLRARARGVWPAVVRSGCGTRAVGHEARCSGEHEHSEWHAYLLLMGNCNCTGLYGLPNISIDRRVQYGRAVVCHCVLH